jgi:hypothetical protein
MYRFVLGTLGIGRVSHLRNAEDGPGGIFVTLRALAGSSIWGELLDCFYCLSNWVALPFAPVLGGSWPEKLLLLPALSAAAILPERWQNPQMVEFREDPAPSENRERATP